MKNLKINFGLFSLLAVLATSVFLTSCEQEEIIDVMEEQTSDVRDNILLLMPHGFETLSEKEQAEYLGNLTEEDYAKLGENHRLGTYLRHIDKYWDVYDSMEEGQLVLDVDLSSVLTIGEVGALSDFQYDNIEARGCGGWNFSYSYFSYEPYYHKRCLYVRECIQFRCCFYFASWNEYVSNSSCQSPDVI